MAIVKTIGGDRLGSGSKMKAALRNYERSTHDIGNVWRSTLAPGVLVPFYKKICPNGDTWTINLKELVRTMPAIGPLFGQYKLQLDMFECPIRLYNGILHNNMTKIGMDMSKVKLPKMKLQGLAYGDNYEVTDNAARQISTSALLHYLGVKGIGGIRNSNNIETIEREINAVPILAYYDIFKNYYSNKQEEKAFAIGNDVEQHPTIEAPTTLLRYHYWTVGDRYIKINNEIRYGEESGLDTNSIEKTTTGTILKPTSMREGEVMSLGAATKVTNDTKFGWLIDYNGIIDMTEPIYVILERTYEDDGEIKHERYLIDNTEFNITNGYGKLEISEGRITLIPYLQALITNLGSDGDEWHWLGISFEGAYETINKVKLQSFNLDNIDQCRIDILKNTDLNNTVYVGDNGDIDYAPYNMINSDDGYGNSTSKYDMQGMVVKTYQSDILNNWMSTDWIDGLNGITNITAVDVSGGTLNLDALNLKQKVYNMMNQIAISGGTYEDWQEAVYGEEALRRAESPIYCGGASGIIAFEEVVSTADTLTENAGDQPLGSLAGKGTLTDTKGGNIEIHIKEPCYIIGIVSITPYLDYSQGNDFDMFEIDSLDDLHKPALDEIGFQDLLLERAAWWATEFDAINKVWIKHAGGKLPAWIEYMTSLNEVHGEFADKTKLGYMVLTRDYEKGYGSRNDSRLNNSAPLVQIPIKDWTTYINPTKFNYQFADTSLTAQNFWVQIGINATVRRKISAKLIPNL